jgi:cytoskeletal protein CcmA (bactofilin family)
VPVAQASLAAPAADESLLAAEDRFEGKLTTIRGVRILGTVDGSIESQSHVHIDENATVTADVSAEEVVIAGHYSGNLVCRQRLEILPTGRVSGSIQTFKLLLHEGGYVDGELHMQKPSSAADMPAETPGCFESTPRSVGSIRSTVEPSVRQPAATDGGSSSAE